MAIETIQIANFVGCSDYTPSSLAQGWQDFRASLFYTMGDDIVQLPFGVFYETDILKMEKVNDGNGSLNIYIRTNPLDNWVMGGTVSTSNVNSFCLLFAIDNDTQKASIFTCVGIPGGYYAIDSRTTFYKNDTNDMYYVLTNSLPVSAITSNGGGATHIAKRAGLLSSIGASNLSDILMVSGGGGGGLLVGDTDYSGKEAGGISGSGDNSADQSTGNAFGQGESGTGVSGGGGGLYGGYKGTSSKSGGAGSGYIGNTLVSNKKMVGYNVPTSSAESTKTESVNEASESPVSGKPKIGNGYAKIKLVRELHYNTIALPIDNQVILKPSDGSDWTLSSIPAVQKEPYMYDSSRMIVTGQMNCAELQENDNVYSYPYNNVSYNNTRYYYYLGGTKHIRGGKVKYRNTSGNHFPRFHIMFYDTQTWSAVGTLVSSSSGEITQDYIDVDLLFDVEANYLEIRGAADGFDFKDLKLLYE